MCWPQILQWRSRVTIIGGARAPHATAYIYIYFLEFTKLLGGPGLPMLWPIYIFFEVCQIIGGARAPSAP